MTSWKGLCRAGAGLALAMLLGGCGLVQQVTDVLNPDLLASLGFGTRVATLPGDAPGLLVYVENRTGRWAAMSVAYRTSDNRTDSFTTSVAPRNKSGQMLICPITEITVGDVSNIKQSGARIFLIDNVTDTAVLDTAPYIEVDAFGVLLLDGINYDCGDGITFTIQESSISRSGYQVYAYIRRAGQ